MAALTIMRAIRTRLAYLMNDGPTLCDRQLRSVTTARINPRMMDSADPAILVRR
jgi:hypothetical protein